MPLTLKLGSTAAISVGLPILVTGLGYLPTDWISHSTLLMLYLMAVLYCALKTDWRGVLVSAVLAFLLFNYFHTQPRYSLWMHDVSELMAALAFIVFALLAGGLANRLRRQVLQLQFQERFLTAQLDLINAPSDSDTEVEFHDLLNRFAERVFGDRLSLHLAPDETDPLTGARALKVTLTSDRGLPRGWETLMRGLGEQVATTLEKQQALVERKRAERRANEEGLRNALLSSVSHDLKTPLVTMMGSATSLRELHEDLSEADRLELLDSIIDESRRLEQYIQNLLDMTRLGHGELSLNRQWISVDELYHVVIRRLGTHDIQRVQFESPADVPPLWVHAALIEQALFNALDNALKASPSEAGVLLTVRLEADRVHLDVCDRGEGLPQSEWEAVFEPFYSFTRGDQYTKGSGLGLTICRGMLRVHGGDACILPAPEGYGHRLRLTLPLTTPQASETRSDDDDTDD
ncbi:sensor histidine kinase [Saccharospirillum salsuginis]|uniref:histidine kinase n=1 Tax=Saccharospirillum salsuginis TaxID=418750 RepID=A0A918K4S3_9GAMM|nr:DUF4118 domain-containing protein [Saccharospirillum salsuginis]GGX48901.1 hypothetical protein GCM10007392_15140 [Saccharospirillum salsuginis]